MLYVLYRSQLSRQQHVFCQHVNIKNTENEHGHTQKDQTGIKTLILLEILE